MEYQQTPDQEMEAIFQVPNIRGANFPGPGVSKRFNLTWLAQLFTGNPQNGGDVEILNSVMQLLKQPDWGSFWLMRISEYLNQCGVVVGAAPEKDLYLYIERRWTTYAAGGPEEVLREAAKQVDELARVFYLPLTYMRTLVDCVHDVRTTPQLHVAPGFPTGGPTPQPLGGWQQYTGSMPGGIMPCSDDRLMSGRIHAAGFATDTQRDRPRVDLTGGRFVGSEHPDPATTLAKLDPYKVEWRHFPFTEEGMVQARAEIQGDLAASAPLVGAGHSMAYWAHRAEHTQTNIDAARLAIGGDPFGLTTTDGSTKATFEPHPLGGAMGDFTMKIRELVKLSGNSADATALVEGFNDVLDTTLADLRTEVADFDATNAPHVNFSVKQPADKAVRFEANNGVFWISTHDLHVLLANLMVKDKEEWINLIDVAEDFAGEAEPQYGHLVLACLTNYDSLEFRGRDCYLGENPAKLNAKTIGGLLEAALGMVLEVDFANVPYGTSLPGLLAYVSEHSKNPVVTKRYRGLFETELNAAKELEESPVQAPVEAAEPGIVYDTTRRALLHVTFGAEPFVAPCTEFTGIKGTFWITDTDLFALMREVSVWCDGRYQPLVNVVRDAIELGGYTQQDLLAKLISHKSGVSYQGNNFVVNGVASVLSELTMAGLVEAAVCQYIRQLYEDHETLLVLAVGVTIDNQDDRKVVIAERWLELMSAIKATMGALTKTLEWSEVTVKRELAGYQRAAYGLAPKPLDIDMPVLFQVPQRINARYTSFPILVEDFRTLLEAIKVQSCPEYKNAEWYTVSMLEYLQWCAKTMVGSEYSDSLDLIKRIANLLSNKKATRLENGDTFELSGVGAFTYSPQLLSDMIWGWLLHCGAELVCNRGTEVPTSVFDATKVDITLGGASVRATVLWRLFSGHMASMNRDGGKPNVYANSTGSTITLKNGDQRAFVDLPQVKWLLG